MLAHFSLICRFHGHCTLNLFVLSDMWQCANKNLEISWIETRASGNCGYHSYTCHSPSAIASSTRQPLERSFCASLVLSLINKSLVAVEMNVGGKFEGISPKSGETPGKETGCFPAYAKLEGIRNVSRESVGSRPERTAWLSPL